ncbi:cupin domain-containing protein [Nocardioides sp. MAHUQ-72]|uniref:cupin domain-containing protein n=1 Tax=unclassified Nocardioides TaxID=2615069 RepID=UPI00360F023F
MSLHVSPDTARKVSTPAATMVTLASPTTAPALDLAVWRTELPAGSVGPHHTIDVDQFLVVLSGAVRAEIDATSYDVRPGEGLKLPAGTVRVLSAGGTEPAVTLTVGHPDAFATVGGGDPVPVPWTA